MASEDNPRYREHNEDAHFAHKIDEGLIAGVFDGHSGNGSDGKIVSNFAAKYFSYHFPLYYKKYHLKGILSVKEVFEKIISEMDEELSKDMISFRAGCTAVCCFIEQESHLIYTATLGDSEANLYRKFGDEILSIPLSIVRDWSSQKDANRAALALKDPSVAEEWPKETLSKELRFKGLNVARAIGDRQCSGHGIRAVVPTPKITVNVVYPGDRLLVTCDGVKDFTREEDLTRLIQKIDNGTAKYPHLTLAQQVVNLAINHASSDNVTVVAVNFIGKEENG
jgi:serine/threonine protein phosphatase PrpC